MVVSRRYQNQPDTPMASACQPNVEAPLVYPRGRVCAERGCKAVLSRYNPTMYCALHHKGLGKL